MDGKHALYKGRYLIAFVTDDDLENIIALFDNAMDYAQYEGCNPNCACGTIEKVMRGICKTMTLNGRTKGHKLRLIDVFEEDRHTKTFKEFRDEWLYAMGDTDTVVITQDRKRHGTKNNEHACHKMNDSFFDQFDNYIVEDVVWKKRVTVWLGNRQ